MSPLTKSLYYITR